MAALNDKLIYLLADMAWDDTLPDLPRKIAHEAADALRTERDRADRAEAERDDLRRKLDIAGESREIERLRDERDTLRSVVRRLTDGWHRMGDVRGDYWIHPFHGEGPKVTEAESAALGGFGAEHATEAHSIEGEHCRCWRDGEQACCDCGYSGDEANTGCQEVNG